MKSLDLCKCDLSTAKLIIESRRFNYIKIRSSVAHFIDNISIDTQQLEVKEISLEEILDAKSIKTNSLIIDVETVEFTDSLCEVDIRFVLLF